MYMQYYWHRCFNGDEAIRSLYTMRTTRVMPRRRRKLRYYRFPGYLETRFLLFPIFFPFLRLSFSFPCSRSPKSHSCISYLSVLIPLPYYRFSLTFQSSSSHHPSIVLFPPLSRFIFVVSRSFSFRSHPRFIKKKALLKSFYNAPLAAYNISELTCIHCTWYLCTMHQDI